MLRVPSLYLVKRFEELLYCYNGNHRCVVINDEIDFDHRFMADRGFFEGHEFVINENNLILNGEEINCLNNIRNLFKQLIIIMGIKGLIVLDRAASKVEINPKKSKVTASFKTRASYQIEYDDLFVFSSINAIGLEVERVEKKNLIIYDYFAINKGAKRKSEIIELDGVLPKVIFVCESTRTDNPTFKDIVCLSEAPEENLAEFEYSWIPLKYKIYEAISSIKIEPLKRITRNMDKVYYKDYPNIHFLEGECLTKQIV